MYHCVRATMLWVVLLSLAVTVVGEEARDEDWIDLNDMINYDPSTKTMRKPVESANYPHMSSKRREHTPDCGPPADTQCSTKLEELQKKTEQQSKKIKALSEQPTYTPVFRRFLHRLLNEIRRVGEPTDAATGLYDATIKLSRQSMTEIQVLLDGDENWRPGALDNAISHILVNLKPHDQQAWKWRFEDSFGIDLDTVLKLGLGLLVVVAIISTELWSWVGWCAQLGRLIAVCFFISIIWNWFYMYKIAFADRQKDKASLEGISEKCAGLKNYDWYDNLKGMFLSPDMLTLSVYCTLYLLLQLYRSTFTWQDDPCKKYYEVVFVNPLLLVPPTKAISVTIVTFFTEPLKHVGEGISDFIRALLKDLPVTGQIIMVPVVVLLILVFMYLTLQGIFQYGIMATFRRPQLDPPPPQRQQLQQHLHGIEEAPLWRASPRVRGLPAAKASGTQVQRRRSSRSQERAARTVVVETLRTAERRGRGETGARRNSSDESDSDESPRSPEEPKVAAAAKAGGARTQDKSTDPKSPRSVTEQKKEKKGAKDEAAKPKRAPRPAAEQQPPQTANQDPTTAEEDHGSLTGVPVQETAPTAAEQRREVPPSVLSLGPEASVL